MANNLFTKANQFLQSMVDQGQIPGAVYAVLDPQRTLALNAVGFSHLKERIPMDTNILFDLASLTKVVATLPCLFQLVEEGLLDFDDSIERFFPQSINKNLTIRHLLTHTSGYYPSIPFYQYGWSKQQILEYLLTQEVELGQKVVYSDLNFILLGFLIEKITKMPLDVISREKVFKPLGMKRTRFCPNENYRKIAPTEWMENEQNFCWGIVHDENARYLNGVSGHAGLFSDIQDLSIYVRMLLNNGFTENNSYFFSPSLLKASRQNYTAKLQLNRGLGWQLNDFLYSPAGYLASAESFGHTGFTGTSFWIDPEKKIATILLTNRIHISREINMNRIRRIFHTIVFTELSKNGVF